MSDLIRQVLIALLSLSRTLETKYVSSNNEPCMLGPFLIDLNPAELKYYLFMISLDKCNVVILFHLSIRSCVPSKTRSIC